MFDWIAGLISRLGYTGVILLTFLENVCPPIPSELVIPMAGFVAEAEGRMRVSLVIAAGSFGSLAGATFCTCSAGRSASAGCARGWTAMESG